MWYYLSDTIIYARDHANWKKLLIEIEILKLINRTSFLKFNTGSIRLDISLICLWK